MHAMKGCCAFGHICRRQWRGGRGSGRCRTQFGFVAGEGLGSVCCSGSLMWLFVI